MTDFADALRRELDDAAAQARAAGTDHDAALSAADRFKSLIEALDAARRKASDDAKALIAASIKAGTDPRDFYGRPFSGTVVRDVAKGQAGVTFPHRGRRARATPHRKEDPQ